MNTVIVGLGSNIDPEANIRRAKELLSSIYTVVAESRFVQTKPVGFEDQADFLNGAILLKTDIGQEQLNSELKNVELALGRKKTANKFGPRTIDLDILVWNEKILDKDFHSRNFIKGSVLELIPNLKH